MPPKAKYTREEIIEAAFEMTREKGIESVVARKLGERLGISSSPIFTAFKNMEELQGEVRKLAMEKFEEYVGHALEYTPAFKYVGIKMVQFAMDEPKLFQLLYMQEHEENLKFEDFVGELGKTAEFCLDVMQKDYELTRQEVKLLYGQVWVHTFGICALVANRVCCFTEEEISTMLSMAFQGCLRLIKSGKLQKIEVRKKSEDDLNWIGNIIKE